MTEAEAARVMISEPGKFIGAISNHIGGRDVPKVAPYVPAAHTSAMSEGAAGHCDREGDRSRRAAKETGEIERYHD
jgi:hypothetical protein